MRYRKLTPTGDYSFGNGQLDFYINSPAAIAQVVQTGLLLWLGEFFLDTTQGVPYLQGILGKHSQSVADRTVQDEVLGFQGVLDIQNYESTLDPINRKFSVSFDIDTIYGPTSVQVANYANY